MENIVEGLGSLSITLNVKDVKEEKNHEVVRLIDEKKQIEILFNPKPTPICNTIKYAYTIMGLPDAHIVFTMPIYKAFLSKKSKKKSKKMKKMLIY